MDVWSLSEATEASEASEEDDQEECQEEHREELREENHPHILPSLSSYGIPLDRQNLGRGVFFKPFISNSLADLIVGVIYTADWVPNFNMHTLCYTSRVNIIEGPDLPPRIWSSDCDWQISQLEGRGGLWRVPPMTKCEGWCLMLWDKSAITCAVSVARVDGIEREFKYVQESGPI
ncbi:hypothetical protein F5X96DRAFT_664977 [Biscogniauxia mediterranea]|nr:hypothetical protein F5X96DRAFT_664977 [Biscogniauxia mediterranea]